MNLYEITDELVRIEQLYISMIDEETGEITGDIAEVEKLEKEIEGLLIKKSSGIIKYIKNIEYTIDSKKQEEERLKESRQRDEKRLESFKKYVIRNIDRLGVKKIETSVGDLSIRNSKSVEIEKGILKKDERYWSVKTEDVYDKRKIKKLIDDGEVVEGAVILEKQSLSIK